MKEIYDYKYLMESPASSSFINSESAVEYLSELGKLSKLTLKHSLRVAELTPIVAIRLNGSSRMNLCVLTIAGLLHDIGKIRVPKEILTSKNPLTEEQRKIMDQHAEMGAGIVRTFCLNPEVANLVANHHREPTTISELTLAVCDNLDALMNGRSYKPGYPIYQTAEILRERFGSEAAITTIQTWQELRS